MYKLWISYIVGDPGGLQFEPFHKKDKKRLMYIKRERDELSFNLRFDYIDNYIKDFDNATENVKNKIMKDFISNPCGCGRKRCTGGTVLTYNGKKLTKCIMSGSFCFTRINETDAQSILKLFECEIRNRVINLN